jgi:phage baseplate assembly protein W
MSRDIQIAFPCPHIIEEERVELSSDRLTLTTRQPISGRNLLKILVNNEYEVLPGTGISTRAALAASRAEPYLVVPGEQSLTIQTAFRQATTTLPPGYLSADQIVSLLNPIAQVPGDRPFFVAEKNESGVLVLRENSRVGPESQIKAFGTAAANLGFDFQFGSVGRIVVPPFTLVRRTAVGSTSDLNLGYEIRFLAPVQANYFFSVTYLTPWNLCPRCRGTEVENDYRFTDTGAVRQVQDHNLLYQACLKVILTDLGSNIYHQWYGSSVSTSVGSKATAGAQAAIQQSVSTALNNFQGLQTAQSKYQRVTAKERLFAVDQVSVVTSPDDPTVFLINVQIRSYSNEPVEIDIVYTAPGAYALPGTNRLSLGSYG